MCYSVTNFDVCGSASQDLKELGLSIDLPKIIADMWVGFGMVFSSIADFEALAISFASPHLRIRLN